MNSETELDNAYGAYWFRKLPKTFDLVCAEKSAWKASIRLADVQGKDYGWCPCFKAFESVRVGDLVQVAGRSLTRNGKIQHPRFVRVLRYNI